MANSKRVLISLAFLTVCFLLAACGWLGLVQQHPAGMAEAPLPTSVKKTATAIPPATATALPVPSATGSEPAPTLTVQPSPTAAYGLQARRHMEVLSQDIGARVAGSRKSQEAAAYIRSVFEELGYDTSEQAFTYYDWWREEQASSVNILARQEGLSPQVVVIGAHYDSVDAGSGADDNASGVAVMLETAAWLAGVETPYTLEFVAFGAEENDLDGSYDYVERLDAQELRQVHTMINLDSLTAGNHAYVYGERQKGSMYSWVLQLARGRGLELYDIPAEDLDEEDGSPCECADYSAFQQAHIPFVYFESTDWTLGKEDGMTQVERQYGDQGIILHTPYDTMEYLDETFPGRIDERLEMFTGILVETLTQYR